MFSVLRKHSGKAIKLLASPFIMLKIPANIVSISGIIFAVIAVYNIYFQNYFVGFIFSVLAVIPDLIDGTIARELNQDSPWGNYFETIIDKIVMSMLIGSLVFANPLLGMLALGFSWLVSYAKPRAGLVIVTDNRDWPGIGEHSDKLVLFLAGLLSANFYPSILGFKTLAITSIAIFVIAFIGSIQRILYAKKLILKAEKNGFLLPYLKEKKES